MDTEAAVSIDRESSGTSFRLLEVGFLVVFVSAAVDLVLLCDFLALTLLLAVSLRFAEATVLRLWLRSVLDVPFPFLEEASSSIEDVEDLVLDRRMDARATDSVCLVGLDCWELPPEFLDSSSSLAC